MNTIQAPDQATVDRWLADHRWVEFAPGVTYADGTGHHPATDPPADWTEAPPCETCDGRGRLPCRRCGGFDGWWLQNDGHNDVERVYCGRHLIITTCPDCGGSGKQRLAVQVPCERCRIVDKSVCPVPGCEGRAFDKPGLVTVAWATVEWGPVPVIKGGLHPGYTNDPHRPGHVMVFSDGTVRRWPDNWDLIWDNGTSITLPPDVDSRSLIGQWARGGKIQG